MKDKFGPTRRTVLTGLAATAVPGKGMIQQANAQQPRDHAKDLERMRDAGKELYYESIEKPGVFKRLQEIDLEFKKKQVSPRESDYKQKLVTQPGFNWGTEEGKRYESYIQQWMKRPKQ